MCDDPPRHILNKANLGVTLPRTWLFPMQFGIHLPPLRPPEPFREETHFEQAEWGRGLDFLPLPGRFHWMTGYFGCPGYLGSQPAGVYFLQTRWVPHIF